MKAAQGFSTLRRWLAASRHILANTGLADVDAELEQFAVDARRSPQRIVAAHLPNQVPRFLGDRRPSRLAAPHLPGPEHPKPLAVNHRLRFHDDQGRPPAGPEPRQPGPEKSVRSGQLRSLHRALQNVELMAKSEHLNLMAARVPHVFDAAFAAVFMLRWTGKARFERADGGIHRGGGWFIWPRASPWLCSKTWSTCPGRIFRWDTFA